MRLLAKAPITRPALSILTRPRQTVSYFTTCNLYITFPLYLAAGGGKVVSGYQKTSATHSYGAGALNIEASTNVPKVKENLGVAKTELAGTSQYGAGAVLVEGAINAPKIKHEALGQVDKTK